MSTKFNEEINLIRSKIEEQCGSYRSNFEEFSDLISSIKNRNQFNAAEIKNCEQILYHMNCGDVRVIFCGQVKSGKTKCVMEFLCGSIELPSKDVPATKYFAKIFYSNPPVLYSESSEGGKVFFDFDGKFVGDEIIENRGYNINDDENLDLIFNIGINDSFLRNGVIVVDSPGLNETKSLDEVFKLNLKKLNPQLVIYIFNYGPGFVDSDCIYYTTVIANLRIDLKKIFLFNKFDEAFKPSKRFPPSSSESENSSDASSKEEEDDDSNEFEELYNKEFDKHKKKLDAVHCGISCPCLIGYSGKFTGLHRCKRDQDLKPFRYKHIELLNHLKCNINSMDLEVLDSILRYTKQFLFTEFQTIFKQISLSNNTSQHSLLAGCYKDKIMDRFDSSHERLLNTVISQIPAINFDGAICQIVKNQERIQTTVLQTKFVNIINSLTKFFIDRYVNYFANIILGKLEELTFDKLNDELRFSGIDNIFSHTFCSLSFETEKIEQVIKLYFEKEEERVIAESMTVEPRHFSSTEACTFYIKSHFKFQKDYIWINVENFIKNVIETERQTLELAIEEKKNVIISDLKASKEQIKTMITDSLFVLKKLMRFSNNHFIDLSRNEVTDKKLREFYEKLIKNSNICEKEMIELSIPLNIVFKSEPIDLDDLSYDNSSEFIKYFLRHQYISNSVCKVAFYYREEQHCLCFITNIKDFQPLRLFLTQGLSDSEKFEMIKNLIPILICCYQQNLAIDNFGPDMVFCRRSGEGIDIKIIDSTQHFNEWKYTLVSGEGCETMFHKYPFPNADDSNSRMFYAMCWTILIIIYGSCDNLFPSGVNEPNFVRDIAKKIPKFSINKVDDGCTKIIRLGLKGGIKFEELDNIVSILENMIL